MAKSAGWIRLYRSSFNNHLYFQEPFTKWQAWCDLLLLANYENGYFSVRGVKVSIERGQVGWTTVRLSERWRWSRGKAKRFLDELEMEQQIIQQKNNVTTLISIIKYDLYQADDTANVRASVQQNIQQNVPKTDINNNNNNKITNKEIVGVPPYPPPESVSGYRYLPNGKSYIEREVFFRKEDFEGLPSDKSLAIRETIKVLKKAEISKDDLDTLWEGFKSMNLTFQNTYRNKDDVYNHFLNWCKSQSFLKAARTTPSKRKEEPKPEPQALNLKDIVDKYDKF